MLSNQVLILGALAILPAVAQVSDSAARNRRHAGTVATPAWTDPDQRTTRERLGYEHQLERVRGDRLQLHIGRGIVDRADSNLLLGESVCGVLGGHRWIFFEQRRANRNGFRLQGEQAELLRLV